MYPSTPMQYNKYKTILEQVSHPQEATVNAINEPTKSTTTLDYYNKNAKKIHHRHYICRLRNRAESLPGQTASGSRNLGLRLRFRPRYKIFSGARLQSHCHRRFTGTMQTRKRIYRHSGKTHVVPGLKGKRILRRNLGMLVNPSCSGK